MSLLESPTSGSSGVETTVSAFTGLNINNTPINDAKVFPRVLTLDVGGRKFVTSPDTLCAESGLFQKQMLGRFTWAPQADGSYFLDADPDLFDHLLRFMRRPSIFPLFYDKVAGFNYDLYNSLEAEAEYFQIDSLQEWIREKKYIRAVKVKAGAPTTCDLDDTVASSYNGNETRDLYFIGRTRKVYVCPRGIPVHKGTPWKCGAACAKARGGDGDEYVDEAYTDVVSVRTEIVFNENACRPESA